MWFIDTSNQRPTIIKVSSRTFTDTTNRISNCATNTEYLFANC